jgi:hypothetical protein
VRIGFRLANDLPYLLVSQARGTTAAPPLSRICHESTYVQYDPLDAAGLPSFDLRQNHLPAPE